MKALLSLAALSLALVSGIVSCGGESTAPESTATEGPSATKTSAEVTPTPPATEATDLTGNWLLNLDVVATSGVCQGQENDGAYVENIKIVQTGETVAVTGIVGATDPSWAGTFDGSTLRFEGNKEDDLGTTLDKFALTFDESTGTLNGFEYWSWTGSTGTCPSGSSAAFAQRN